jgi:hypothetical protein
VVVPVVLVEVTLAHLLTGPHIHPGVGGPPPPDGGARWATVRKEVP